MARKTLEEKMKTPAQNQFRADLRFRRQFDRELEREIDRFRLETPKVFKNASRDQKPRTILAEGDSWCRYLVGFAVPWHLEKLDKRNRVMNVGSPGDTASEMLTGKKARRLKRDIRRGPGRNRKFDVIYFSGGGNDLLGDGRFSTFLNDYEQGMTASQVINARMLNKALDMIEGYYENLIGLRDEHSPQSKIYINAYDFAQASNKGVCGKGPWLWPHLDDAGVPDTLHEAVVAEFLRRFKRKLVRMANRLGNNDIVVIGTQGTLDPADWDNEIHPSKGGFRKIAEVFQAQLALDFP
ncbi:MAG: hypothetical protein AAF541_11445 [Pseudomonadota bacterium]